MKFLGTIILGLALVSCSELYLDKPQPIDSQNLYEFPDHYLGIWTDGQDTMLIEKDYCCMIEYSNERVAKSIADTSKAYLFKDGLVYLIDYRGEMMLKGGFPYQLVNDTVYFKERELTEVALSRNSFLRQAGKYHLLNMKEENQWWEVLCLEETPDGHILFLMLSLDSLKHFAAHDYIYPDTLNNKHDHYIKASWTAAEVVKMVEAGAFADTLLDLDPKDKRE